MNLERGASGTDEAFDGATSGCAPCTVPAGAVIDTPVSRAFLARLRDSGVLSVNAWEESLAFCGFTPGAGEWRAYLRHLLLLGGTLFLLSGVIFFIAWNWGAMHRFHRLGMMALIVCATGVAAVWKGPDTRSGRTLLLACGIAVGPALAVFGQTYQTGADLWELFRVWTVILLLLAPVGKQPALWFVAWLSGNVFVMMWLGKTLVSATEAISMSSTLPEAVMVLALALAVWEIAAWKTRSDERFAWLHVRWLPRLLFFDLTIRCMVVLSTVIIGWLGYDYFMNLPVLFLPRMPGLAFLAMACGALSFYWYRKRTQDLFMLACIFASGAVLLISFLLRGKFFFDSGVIGLFVWGLLIIGLTAWIGKILFAMQRQMETDHEKHAGNSVLAVSEFFALSRPRPSWQTLQTFLESRGLIAPNIVFPSDLANSSPWYVKGLLAFGGWISSLLFVIFVAVLLFNNLGMNHNDGLVSGLVGMGFSLLAFVVLSTKNFFLEHFGFALALAGASFIGYGIFVQFGAGGISYGILAALLAALILWTRNAVFRFIAASVVTFLVPAGFSITIMEVLQLRSGAKAVASLEWLWLLWNSTAFWWAALAVGFVLFCLRERDWRGTAWGKILEPSFFGVYAGMLLYVLLALSYRFEGARMFYLFPVNSRALGIGAAVGVMFLVHRLVRDRAPLPLRCAVFAASSLCFILGWYLPGVAMAFLGLAVSRLIGDVVMQGATSAFLFAYMVYYYYFLGVSLFTKSALLAGTGVLLLALAGALHQYGDDLVAAFSRPAMGGGQDLAGAKPPTPTDRGAPASTHSEATDGQKGDGHA